MAQNKPTSPAARREAQAVIEAMKAGLGARWIEIDFDGEVLQLTWRSNGNFRDDFVIAASLDDAYIAALHKQAGTEPAPF